MDFDADVTVRSTGSPDDTRFPANLWRYNKANSFIIPDRANTYLKIFKSNNIEVLVTKSQLFLIGNCFEIQTVLFIGTCSNSTKK